MKAQPNWCGDFSDGARKMDDDERFWIAHTAVLEDTFKGIGTVDGTIEDEAGVMVDIAARHHDRLMWSCVFARMHDYLQAGRYPPMAILKGIDAAFARFCGEARTLDEAFNIAQARRGRPDTLKHREWAKTNAAIVQSYLASGDSLEVAIEKTAEWRNDSESKIKRDYLKYR